MEVLFCAPNDRAIDDGLDREIDALEHLSIPYHLVCAEEVAAGLGALAASALPERDAPCPLLYRGYMISPDAHADLTDALAGLGYHLRISTDEYTRAHLLPHSFDAIAPFSSPTRFVDGFDPDEVWDAARSLGPVPRMLKDHAKSAKHDWWRACHIPKDATREDCALTLDAMIDARGEDLVGGVTVRALADLRVLGRLPGGAPAHEEYRAIFIEGDLIAFEPLWTDLTLHPLPPPEHILDPISRALDLPFCCVDLARHSDGSWVAIEVGAGNASRLPDGLDLLTFYEDVRALLFDESEAR